LDVVKYADLLDEKRKYVLAKQLLKSGTSIGANIREAQGAESKNDFIHKLKISYKEAIETEYWLDICKYSENYPDPTHLYENAVSLKKILARIILTTSSRVKN
jgi:four helix bundle protein